MAIFNSTELEICARHREGGEWGGGNLLSIRLWGLGERRELPQRVPEPENEFGAYYLP